MALSRLKNDAKAAPATEATPAPVAKEETKKVAAKAAIAEDYADASVLSSKSATIQFVAPIGDPSTRDIVKQDGKDVSNTPYIVGYRLKALEDMVVPHCGLADDARKNKMSYADSNATIAVKAGQEFDVTRFDLGLLLAPPEFNGKITGGGVEYTAVYALGKNATANGGVTKTGAAQLPTVSLKSATGSIKDQRILECLTVATEEGPSGTTRKVRTIVPGFEYFQQLCVAPVQKTRAPGAGAAQKNQRNKNAQLFLQIVKSK
jgi:hypothetical protein